MVNQTVGNTHRKNKISRGVIPKIIPVTNVIAKAVMSPFWKARSPNIGFTRHAAYPITYPDTMAELMVNMENRSNPVFIVGKIYGLNQNNQGN